MVIDLEGRIISIAHMDIKERMIYLNLMEDTVELLPLKEIEGTMTDKLPVKEIEGAISDKLIKCEVIMENLHK